MDTLVNHSCTGFQQGRVHIDVRRSPFVFVISSSPRCSIIAIPVVLILLFLCAVALQREIRWIMIASLVLMIASETYFIYKLVRFYDPVSRHAYESSRGTLTVFSKSIYGMSASVFLRPLRSYLCSSSVVAHVRGGCAMLRGFWSRIKGKQARW